MYNYETEEGKRNKKKKVTYQKSYKTRKDKKETQRSRKKWKSQSKMIETCLNMSVIKLNGKKILAK